MPQQERDSSRFLTPIPTISHPTSAVGSQWHLALQPSKRNVPPISPIHPKTSVRPAPPCIRPSRSASEHADIATIAPGPPEPSFAGGVGWCHGGAGGADGRLRGAPGQVHGRQRVRLRLRHERPLVPARAAGPGGPRARLGPREAPTPTPELEKEGQYHCKCKLLRLESLSQMFC